MPVYGVIVTSREARCQVPGDPFVITNEGERFWATAGEWGPTSGHFRGYGCVPKDALTFDAWDAAMKFAKGWRGHPWWCIPKKGEYEIVVLAPKTRQVPDGYTVI